MKDLMDAVFDNQDVIEPDKDIIVSEEETEEAPVEEPVAETVAEKAWKELGIEGWDGKSREQIAEEVKWQRQVKGRHDAEVGEIRRKLQEAESKLSSHAQIAGLTKVEATVDQMTEGQLADFYRDMEVNPKKAISNLIKSQMTEEIKAAVLESIKEQKIGSPDEMVGEISNKIEWRNFTEKHDDWEDYYGMMDVLTKEEHLGTGRPYGEVYELAKLSKENEPLYRATYQLMAKSQMSFSDCKSYAELKIAAPVIATTKKDQIKKEVANIAGGGGGATVTKEAEWQVPEGVDPMDAAFA